MCCYLLVSNFYLSKHIISQQHYRIIRIDISYFLGVKYYMSSLSASFDRCALSFIFIISLKIPVVSMVLLTVFEKKLAFPLVCPLRIFQLSKGTGPNVFSSSYSTVSLFFNHFGVFLIFSSGYESYPC